MIVASIGLLVVAAVLLFVGIAKSSLAPLVLSLLATLGAGGLLYASFLYYRKKAVEEGEVAAADVRVEPGYPASYARADGVRTAVVLPAPPAGVSMAAAPAPAPAVPAAAAAAGNGSPVGWLPNEQWDDLSTSDAIRLVEALNIDELHAVRRHEVEHARRRTVLRAIDARIDAIIELRRSVAKG